MDVASRIKIEGKIKDAQRILGNLHAWVTNSLSSSEMAVGDKEVTADDVVVRMDNEINLLQSLLREISSEIRK